MKHATYTKIEKVLENFGVDAKVVDHTEGPNVWQFHVVPGPNQPISSILKLEDDLALRLSAQAVRIVQLLSHVRIPYVSVRSITVPCSTVSHRIEGPREIFLALPFVF